MYSPEKPKHRKKKKNPFINLIFIIVICAALFIGLKTMLNKIINTSTEQPGITSNTTVLTSATTSQDSNEIAITMETEDIYKGDLILVNNNTPYHFTDTKDLVSLFDYKASSYYVKDKNVLLDNNIIEHLNDWMDDFYAETNLKTINLISGHRTKDFQQDLYDNSIIDNGAQYTQRYVALAGHSEHHTGLAMDFGIFYSSTGASDSFNGDGEYTWINEHAYEYGFIIRYKEAKSDITGIYYEPWHFRYVGIPHSYIIEQNNFCFEEYIDYLKNYEYDKEHLQITCNGQKYELYFTKSTTVYVPKNKEYTISGNNVDGFIVTVTM